jgi:hypothetical protein
MNKLAPTWFVIPLFAFMTAASQAQHGASDADRLVGAWKLVALEQPGPDGTLSRIDCCGMFVFTRDGHASVQVMEHGSRTATAAGRPEQYSQGGYEASYGSYTVDEKTHIFTFHVEGALVPTLVGKDLPRLFELRGNQLIIKSARPDEHWRVIWEHY